MRSIKLIEKIINNLVLRFGEVKMFLSLSLKFEDEAINEWRLWIELEGEVCWTRFGGSEVGATSEPEVCQADTGLNGGSELNWKARFAELGLVAVRLVRPASLRLNKQSLCWMKALIRTGRRGLLSLVWWQCGWYDQRAWGLPNRHWAEMEALIELEGEVCWKMIGPPGLWLLC